MSEVRQEYTIDQAKAAGLLKERKPAKYRNRWTPCHNGHSHQSALEALRCDQLHLLQQAHKIENLEVQPDFELQPAFVHIRDGKHYRAITFTPDFCYYEDGRLTVEDVKSKATRTRHFEDKRKMLLWRKPGIRFRVVTEGDIG